ncbi:two-component system chemotaxis response regulator CheY [Acetoanaerobium pronyense]|uniref:Stage 0 sporulation protein A homolog n=1 Tax=Acetoanaerobium pronyense TaxID=1482736 RepID=A0ABS4KMH7_9FIRM|nr:response regulator [Acetoanaerobium pronyense]MBP2028978.1 two-component system chemotaxis response regulator CheY [Acetoanaerobium pronyense]
MKILSIDDSAVVRKIIKGAVDVIEFDLVEASDGYEGLEILKKYSDEIKLVLLDWNMPGLSGIEVLKEIKEDENLKSIPVMMVTTESEKENIVKAIKLGASHYVIKPFAMEELTRKILETLGMGGL